MCIAFLNYEKSFISVGINAASLGQQGIEKRCINILAEIQHTHTHRATNHNSQASTTRYAISAKLFTANLEDVFQNLDWIDHDLAINGRKLANLRSGLCYRNCGKPPKFGT